MFVLPAFLPTNRLVLRAPCAADAAAMFAAYTQDAEVARFMTWRPHTALRETESFVSWCTDAWASGRSRPYVLALRDEPQQAIGMLEARLHPHMVDLGYVLGKKHWGTGLMPEAIGALCDAALALPACFRVQASCDTENAASVRTLEKSGFVREGRLERHTVQPNLDAAPRAVFLYARWR